jgi:hypothetical protein
MSDNGDNGDNTGKIRALVHDEIAPLERRTKWIKPVIVLVAAGFTGASWLLTTFARSSETSALETRQEKQAGSIAEIKADVKVIQVEQRHAADDQREQRDQIKEIARAVRARIIPAKEKNP